MVRCNAYDNTKKLFLGRKIKLDGREFFPDLVERNGEILLTKNNVNDIKYITNRYQEFAYKKYGLPLSVELYRVYDAAQPLNKGYQALSIRKKSFQELEKYMDAYEAAQEINSRPVDTQGAQSYQAEINFENTLNTELDLERDELNNFSPYIMDEDHLQDSRKINARYKIYDALEKINRPVYKSDKAQGWLNELKKQGVPQAQIEFFTDIAEDGMTKEELAQVISDLYDFEITLEESTDPESYYKKERYISGGTNYTELDIVADSIYPLITSHADFSAENSIGWLRYDEVKENGQPVNKGRVIEMQSDIFQKDKKKGYGGILSSSSYKKMRNDTGLTPKEIREQNIDVTPWIKNDDMFLQQFINNDNWIKFFLRSTVQHMWKNGFSSVRFPQGNTIYKIQGHPTIQEEMDLLNKAIEDPDYFYNEWYMVHGEPKTQANRNPVWIIENDYGALTIEPYGNTREKFLEEVRIAKKKLEEAPKAKARPIDYFYSERLRNSLDKIYGKDAIQDITDNEGNTWYEINLEDPRFGDRFSYSPHIEEDPRGVPSSIPTAEEIMNTTKDYKNAYAEYFNYKNNLVSQTKRYLHATNVEIDKTQDPIKKAELIQAQQELKEALYGNEVKGINGLIQELGEAQVHKENYTRQEKKLKLLNKSLEKLQEAGQDTTQVLSQMQDTALKLYEMKYTDLGRLLRTTSLQDLDRAQRLINSGQLDNLVKARQIVSFYKLIDPANQDTNNPYYSRQELIDNKIEPSTLEDLYDLSNKAYDLDNKIINKSRKSILDYINSIDNFLKANDGKYYTEEDIFKDQDGLLDITLLDQVVYNIQDNPFSKVQSVLASAIFKNVQDSISSEEAKVKEISDELDEKNPQVVKELLRLGHRLSDNELVSNLKHKVLGRLDNTPDFTVFKQVSAEGVQKNTLVQRESDKYQSAVKQIKNTYNRELSGLLSGTNVSKTSEQIHNKYYNKLRSISQIVKPHLMPEIVNDPKYADLLDDNTRVEQNDDYKNSIVSLIGQQGYEDTLEAQRKALDSYIIAKEQKASSLIYMYALEQGIDDMNSLNLSNLDQEKQDAMIDWEIDHSPFYNGLLFDENKKVKIRDRRYNHYELDYSKFLPRTNEAKVVFQRSYTDSTPLNFRLVRTVEQENKPTGFYDERYKYIENNPILYDFWKTAMKSSDYYQQSLSPQERQNWEKGDLPIDDNINIERFSEESDRVKDKILAYISKQYRSILKRIYSSISSSMDVPYTTYDYNDNKFKINTSSLNVGARSIANEIRLKEIQLKQLFKEQNKIYKEVLKVQDLPIDYLKEALFLYGTNPTRLTNMDDATITREFISAFNIVPNRAGNYVTNILGLLKDLHTQNAIKQTNGDLGLALLKSASLASGIIARQKNVDMIQFMVDAFNNIKKADSNSFSTQKINNKTGNKVIAGEVRAKAVSQMNGFISNVLTLRGLGSDNHLISDKDEAEALKHGFFNNYVLDNEKDLDLIDNLLEDERLSSEDKSDLLRIKLQKIRYFDGVKGILRPVAAQLRLVSLGYKTVSNFVNLYEGTKQLMIHDSTGQDWTPGKITEALNIMKGAFIRNFTQFGDKLIPGKTITPQASKARFIIDRLDFIEDASTLEAKALKKQTTRGIVKDIASGLSPYVLIKKIEYVNQGSVALAVLMSTPITDRDGNVSNVWDAYDGKGKMKPEFATEHNINTWEKFDTQEALDFKAKIRNARNKTSGDYSQIGESQLNSTIMGKLVLNFKKWMPKYIAQMYGNYRFDYDTGEYVKGRAKSLHPAEMIFNRIAAGLTLKGFGTHALMLVPLIVGDFYAYHHDLDPNKPQLKDMAVRLGMMSKVALKTAVGLPINLVASGIYKNKPIVNHSNDKILGKSLEQKLLDRGVKPEDIGNIKAMGVEFGMNLLNAAALLLVYGTLLAGGGDDDDEDTPKTLGYTKNEWGNIAQNSLLPLLQQGEAFYSDPLQAFTSINNIPLMTWIEQMTKTSESVDKVINDLDTDYIARGRDAGKYKSDKLMKKILPVPLRDMESKKYMRFKEYVPGQLLQNQTKALDKKIGNLRSEIKFKIGEDIKRTNIEQMYSKYGFEYEPEDKDGEMIPYPKMKEKLLNKIMKSNLPKPDKGDMKKAYEDLQEVRDGNMSQQEWNSQYVKTKEEKEDSK